MWYEKNYRRVFMDMHLDDSKPDEYLSKLDTDDFVKTLVDSNVTNIVVKAKSHVGLHYWPCKIGKMHEGLKRRNLDYVGEMIKKCHAQNIDVIVYYSQTHDNYAYDTHPEWRVVYKDSTTSRDTGGRYGLVCMNNMDYRQYCKDILTELLTTYDYEGMFLDMPFWSGICHCQSCRKRFFDETGESLPQEVDWNNPLWVKFAHLRQAWVTEYAKDMSDHIKSIKPNVSIEHNFAAVGASWMSGDVENLVDTCDYAGGDYYGGYLQQTFMCKYYNSVTPNKPFSYITSRCDPNLYAHTVSRCKEDLLIHTMNALVHGGAFSMCDAMNPDGTITKEVYANAVKDVYATSAKYEGYVSGDLLCDVAVWYNTNMKANDNFMHSPMGVGEIMREYNMPYDVIGSKNLKNLDRQVLSINDAYEITDAEMRDIEAYLNRGGNVFITGKLANKRLEELLEVTVKGESEYTYTYLNPTASYKQLFETFNQSSPYPIEHKAYECTSNGDAEILATLTYPYTKRSEKDFSAIHSDPPGIHTDMPSVLLKNVGKGKILWVVAPLELTKAHYCRKTIYRLISSLLTSRKFTSNAPDFVEIVGWQKNSKYYFSAVNQQNKSPVYPIYDIDIKLPYPCKAVKLLTSHENENEKELEVLTSFENGETTIKLPKLDIFHIIEVEI